MDSRVECSPESLAESMAHTTIPSLLYAGHPSLALVPSPVEQSLALVEVPSLATQGPGLLDAKYFREDPSLLVD